MTNKGGVANQNYTVTSLFCGLGGLDLGFEWEGFRVVWANDVARSAVKSYEMNFGRTPISRDITQIPFDEIPSTDVIIGGPPCQSFSLMGKRQSDDPRGRLVFHFYEVVKHKMPRAFVMENVPGMAASRIDNKRVPDILKASFTALGYKVTTMHILAANYLVPQLRRRLVLVGCLDSFPIIPDSALFADECYGIDVKNFDNGAFAAIGDLGPCVGKGKRSEYKNETPSRFAQIMREHAMGDVSLHECPRMSETDRTIVNHIPPGGNYMDIPDHLAPGRVLRYKQTGGRTTTYGRLHPNNPAYTINTYFRRPNVGQNFHYSEPRLITPREAMRFQSIPDHFELVYSSQDERNALIGNAVPPLVGRAIAWSLRKTLSGVENTGQQSQQLTLF